MDTNVLPLRYNQRHLRLPPIDAIEREDRTHRLRWRRRERQRKGRRASPISESDGEYERKRNRGCVHRLDCDSGVLRGLLGV